MYNVHNRKVTDLLVMRHIRNFNIGNTFLACLCLFLFCLQQNTAYYQESYIRPLNLPGTSSEDCGLTQTPLEVLTKYDSLTKCGHHCLKNEQCHGYNWNSENHICELHNTSSFDTLGIRVGFTFMPMSSSNKEVFFSLYEYNETNIKNDSQYYK